MKTLILLILISITGTPYQKEIATATPIQNGQTIVKECKLPSSEQSIEATKYNHQEMPNNWNVKVIEW